jgi:hypothetical protein
LVKPRVKKKDYENLSAENIEKVILLLNPDEGKPATKKVACEVLNISYNTSRLTAIIEAHLEQKAYVSKRKKMNRGKPASNEEISEVVTDYLKGYTIADISKQLFRSAAFVKNIIAKVGVPQRPSSSEDRMSIAYIPEECVAETFTQGEIAWSAVHHKPVEIGNQLTRQYQDSRKGISPVDYDRLYSSKVYQIYVMEKTDAENSLFPGVETGGFFGYSTAYDLGKLTHLQQYGVNLREI